MPSNISNKYYITGKLNTNRHIKRTKISDRKLPNKTLTTNRNVRKSRIIKSESTSTL